MEVLDQLGINKKTDKQDAIKILSEWKEECLPIRTKRVEYIRSEEEATKQSFFSEIFEEKRDRQKHKIYETLKYFTIKGEERELLKFIQNKNLMSYIKEGRTQVQKVFGSSIQQISLEVCEDPEEDFSILLMTLEINLSVDDSLELLDQLQDDWFLDNVPPEISSIFSITV